MSFIRPLVGVAVIAARFELSKKYSTCRPNLTELNTIVTNDGEVLAIGSLGLVDPKLKLTFTARPNMIREIS